MKLAVVCPHFEPDLAPTGAVITRIVHELAGRGHTIEVLTSLPWYRDHSIEPGYEGKWTRHEDVPWGRITRMNPFPTQDKRNILRRAAAFGGFSALAAAQGMRGDPVDGVLAMSPPLTLGLTGWAVAKKRKAPLVFNIQDVYPDVAIEVGALKGKRAIAAAYRLERLCYARSDAITVLSNDLKDNLTAKLDDPAKVHVIPNFVDTEAIRPGDRENSYRAEHGLTGKTVVMYAGNVGLSQSFELILAAATALSYEEDLAFVINGGGSALDELKEKAAGLANVVFAPMQPVERLSEVLAAADIHLVPLKRGLARSSVPSKTYSILAAGRPVVASVDAGSEVARILASADAGLAVPPEDSEAFTKAIRTLLDDPARTASMGASGRGFVESWASPAAVARAYEELFGTLNPRSV
ncbi:MAG: glycosyltransferase [Actinobacteria bacterium]|nr:glycosyltransferase [Actinomycetota bacterium]